MSEVIYAKPDFSKKVRFQTGEKNGDADISGNTDEATIYDNYLTEESTTPKVEENLREDQQQITVSPAKSTFLRVAAVFLGLLCLLLLAAVIVLLVLLIQDKNSWNADRKELVSERQELMTSITEIKRINANLSKTASLLKDSNGNLTKEREQLQEQFDHHCQQGWMHFNYSFYYFSSMSKTWDESRKDCLQRDADLVIIDSEEEQKFIGRFVDVAWIGLTYSKSENKWKWVDETTQPLCCWHNGEPNGVHRNEHCAEISGPAGKKGWNDTPCTPDGKIWICEKKMAL